MPGESDSLKKTFAKNLQDTLTERGISEEELCRQLPCVRAALKSWLDPNDNTLPSLANFDRLTRVLHIAPHFLLGVSQRDGETYGWIEAYPEGMLSPDAEDVHKGIAFFKHLAVEKKAAKQLAHDLRPYNYAFRVATSSGALCITVVPRDMNREKQLCRLLSWTEDKVFVAMLPRREDGSGEFIQGTMVATELVATLAAHYVLGRIDLKNRWCALGPGYSILRTVELTTPSVSRFSGTKWVPLMAIEEPDRDTFAVPANYTATVMSVRHQQSEAIRLPFIPLADRKRVFAGPAIKRTPEEERAYKVYDMLRTGSRNAGAVIMSVGGVCRTLGDNPDPAPRAFTSHTLQDIYQEIPDKSVFSCEVLGMFIDAQGMILHDIAEYNRQKVYTPLEPSQLADLVKSLHDVWIVAAGSHKCEPIRTALNNRLANGLVIDSEIAQYLIDNPI